MRIRIVNPIKAIIESSTDEENFILKKSLTYINTSAQHKLKRHSQNRWFRAKDPEGWELTKAELKKAINNTLVFEENGQVYIRPGSIPHIVSEGKIYLQVINEIVYPTPKKIPWVHPLPFDLHPYQEESWKKLIEGLHDNVELCTGSGKSAILLKVCRETGFRAAIIAPSKSIFNELLEKFEFHFGKGMVGTYGDGKKKLGKKFTICIGDSIANIKPGTPEWAFFCGLDMLCVDESHTWGADTLEGICHGVLANIPYRMFFSGTQTRGDGAAKLLQSIIGKTVCVLTTKEAKEKGYICNHDFNIVEVESSDPNYITADALDMKRAHFLNNSNIAEFIAKLANASAMTYRRQTLVLVEELSQIATLLPMIKVPAVIAHSEKRADTLAYLGLSKVNTSESVEKFNKGEALVLIGTSCISTGTNIYPTHNTVNWVGGSSEIRTKQGAVGRAVRLGSQNPWRDRCTPKEKSSIWDFKVKDVYLMDKHLNIRVGYYGDSGSEIKYIRLPK